MANLPVILPDGFTPIVKTGDPVSAGQIIAQPSGKGEIIINISKMLSISTKKAKKVVKKNPGDSVSENDVIAVKKSLFGRKELLKSKINGTVIRYEREQGNLVIRTSYASLTENLISPVDGVVGLCDNEKITISTDKNVFTGTKGIGESGEGEVYVLEASFAQNANESEAANMVYYLDGRAVGKIIIGGHLSKEILIKGIGIGAAGIIGTKITDEDLLYIEGKKLTTPVLEASSDIIRSIIAWRGKKAYITGNSQTVILLQT